MIQTINPDGGINTVVYTPTGQQHATIDPLGRTNSYTYDVQGRLIQTTFPDGSYSSSASDPNGNRTNTVDQLGRVTSYLYDALNRLVQTVYPDNTSNTTAYDDVGRVQFSIDARGVTNAFGYDAASQRTAVTNAFGTPATNISFYAFDANGNQTLYAYDDAGRLVQTTFPDATSQITAYDLLGQKVAETDQAGIVTAYGYDAFGHLLAVTNAWGTANQAITTYAYDEAGNQTNQIDALGRQTSFEYDDMARRTKRILPGGAAETTGYSIVNNTLQVLHTNFSGVVITNQYDVMGRLTNTAPAIGSALPPGGAVPVQFTYDPATGKRATMTDASGTTTYLYDLMGRLTNKLHSVVGNLTNTYDLAGNLLTIQSSHPGGVSLTYHYDELNRLVQVDDSTGKSTTYDYDRVGNLQDVTYPTANPVKTTYAYNALNRLTNMVVTLGSGLSPAQIASFDYNSLVPLGPAGNRLAVTETIGGATRSARYSYDSLYRSTKEVIADSTGPQGTIDYGAQSGSPTTTGYDSVGNRRSRVVTLTPAAPGLGTVNSTFDARDRLASSTYDINGNTLAESTLLGPGVVTPTLTHTDLYDFADHLIQRSDGSKTIQIVYDGDGNRMWKTVTKSGSLTTNYYLVDDLNPSGHAQVLEELLSQNSSTPTLHYVYNYGLSLISRTTPASPPATIYYGYDGHGNVRFLTDSTGVITDTYTYDAFGILIYQTYQTAPTPNNYLFCGEQWDPDLGAYYLRARYMNPNTGRFWTMDTEVGDQEDPQSLHLYTYCTGNPVNLTDPSGNDFELGALIGVMGISGDLLAQNSPATANAAAAATTAILIPTLPSDPDDQLLVGLVFAESASKKWGQPKGEKQDEKVEMVHTVLNRTYYAAQLAPNRINYNRTFGDGSVLGAISAKNWKGTDKEFKAYQGDRWNEVMNGNRLRSRIELGKLPPLDLEHLKLCIDAVKEINDIGAPRPAGIGGIGTPPNQIPVSFQVGKTVPGPRYLWFVKLGGHNFFAFKPGQEREGKK